MSSPGLYINLENDKDLIDALQRFTRLANGLDEAFLSVSKSINELDKSLSKVGRNNSLKGIREFERAFDRMDMRRAGTRLGERFLTSFGQVLSNTSNVLRSVTRGLESALRSSFTTLGRVSGMAFSTALRHNMISGVRDIGVAVQRELSTLGRNLNNQANNLIQRGFYTTLSGGIAGQFLGQFGDSTAEFNKLLSQIKIFGDLNDAETTQIRSFIEGFSLDSVFFSNDIAEATLALLRSGVPISEISEAIPNVYALAVAGDLGLGEAAESTVRALQTYGADMSDASEFADLMVAAADISTADVAGIVQAQSFVGPSAGALGITFREINALIAQLSDTGILNERAGTGLRALFDSLIDPSVEAQKTLKQFGIVITDEEGNFKNAVDLLTEFAEAVEGMRAGGMGEADIVGALASLGSRNAITALLALLRGNDATEDPDDLLFEDYLKRIDQANSSMEIAEAVIDNFLGASLRLRSALQLLINRALTPLQEQVLRPLYDRLTVVVSAIASLPGPILAASISFVALTGIMITLLGASQLLAGFLLFSLGPVFSTLGTIMFAVLNPLAALFTTGVFLGGLATATALFVTLGSALAIVGAGLILLLRDIQRDVGGLRTSLTSFFDAIGGLIESVFGFISSIGQLLGVVKADSTDMENAVTPIFTRIANVIDKVTEAIDRMSLAFRDAANFVGDIVAVFTELTTPLENINVIVRGTGLESLIGPSLPTSETTGLVNNLISGYTVRAGDTMTAIARELGIPLQELIDLNKEIVENPNLIFPGQELITGGGGTDAVSLTERFTDAIADMNHELSASDRLARNPIFIRLFGEDTNAARAALAFVRETRETLRSVASAINIVRLGVIDIFSGNFLVGIEGIVRGFSRVTLAALEFGELLFGYKLSDSMKDAFYRGDLSAVIEGIFDAIKNVVLGNAESVAKFAATALEFFVRGIVLGIPRLIANIFDITAFDGVFQTIDTVAKVAGELLRGGIEFTFDVLEGDANIEESVDTLLGNIRDILNESPIYQEIQDRLSFASIDFAPLQDRMTMFVDSVSELGKSEGFANFVKELGRMAVNIASIAVNLLRLGGEGILSGLATLVDYVNTNLPTGADNLSSFNDVLSDIANTLSVTTLEDVGNAIRGLLPENFGILGDAFNLFVSEFNRFLSDPDLQTYIETITRIGVALGRLLAPILGLVATGVLTIMAATFRILGDVVLPVVNSQLGPIATALEDLADFMYETDWDAVVEPFVNAFNSISSFLRDDFLPTVGNTLADFIEGVAIGVSFVDDISGGFLSTVTGANFEFDRASFLEGIGLDTGIEVPVNVVPVENEDFDLRARFAELIRENGELGDLLRENGRNMLGEDFISTLLGLTDPDSAVAFLDVADGVVDGIIQGFDENGDPLQVSAEDMAMRIRDGFYTALEIQSPSQLMMRAGLDVVEGLRLGMMNNMGRIDQAIGVLLNKFRIMVAELNIIAFQSGAILGGIGSNVIPSPTPAPAIAPNAPGFARGGYTGNGGGAFGAILHPREYVIPSRGVPVIREQTSQQMMMNNINGGRYAGGGTNNTNQNISYGNITINVPAGTTNLTPEVIAEGMNMYHRQNPPNRRTRNYT